MRWASFQQPSASSGFAWDPATPWTVENSPISQQRSNRGNFTLVDYQNNIYISDDAPSEYVRKYRDSLGEDEYRRNCEEHALPVGFEDLDYEEFLGKRRQLMGELVKGAYERL